MFKSFKNVAAVAVMSVMLLSGCGRGASNEAGGTEVKGPATPVAASPTSDSGECPRVGAYDLYGHDTTIDAAMMRADESGNISDTSVIVAINSPMGLSEGEIAEALGGKVTFYAQETTGGPCKQVSTGTLQPFSEAGHTGLSVAVAWTNIPAGSRPENGILYGKAETKGSPTGFITFTVDASPSPVSQHGMYSFTEADK